MTLELENEYGAASVDTAGARVVSWVPRGGEEILFAPPHPDGYRPDEWRHGGIPVCFPWFGRNIVNGQAEVRRTGVPPVQDREGLNGQDARSPGGGANMNGQDARSPGDGANMNGQDARSPGVDVRRTGVPPVQDKDLPLHGLVHRCEWALVAESPSAIGLELKSNAAMKTWFAGDFRLRLDVTLGTALELRLTIENTGAEPFAYTNGFHPYFRVGDCAAAEVDGVDGCRYWYGLGFGPEPWKGSVTFGEHRDHVFWLGEHRQVLSDRSLGRRITVEHSGNKRLVVWNPGPAGCEGLAPDDGRNFVCVEPATIPAADALTIRPGERQTLEMRISAESI